jgi:hypothetical protein
MSAATDRFLQRCGVRPGAARLDLGCGAEQVTLRSFDVSVRT